MVLSDHSLRRWRTTNKVTLAGLAERVREAGGKVTPSHLSEIERGLNTPSLMLADCLSRATGGEVAINEFVVPVGVS